MFGFTEKWNSYWSRTKPTEAIADDDPTHDKDSESVSGDDVHSQPSDITGSSETVAKDSSDEQLLADTPEVPASEPAAESGDEQKTTGLSRKVKIGLGVGACAVVGGGLLVVAAPLALGAVGFGSSGVVGGSIAAGIQAAIGNVAAGSLFAACQSAGAVGVAASTNVALAATGAVIGGAAAGGAAMATGPKKEEDVTTDKTSNEKITTDKKSEGMNANANEDAKNYDESKTYCESCRKVIDAYIASQADVVSETNVNFGLQSNENSVNSADVINSEKVEVEEDTVKNNVENNIKESKKMDNKDPDAKKYCACCKREISMSAS